jgi:hypothetical protein
MLNPEIESIAMHFPLLENIIVSALKIPWFKSVYHFQNLGNPK